LLVPTVKPQLPSTRKRIPLDHDEGLDFLPKLDRSREKQLRAGTLPIDAKIDLHGMRQREAFEALQEFLSTHIARGHRHILVITGKGPRQQGVLRHQLPLWLKTMPEGRHILRMCHAAPRHGGEGAYYILFKNPKKTLKK
jgi:DNA-nicking Smr family endonuclease